MAATLFEVSWEVCNKVGGIHTVIRSKVPFIKDAYHNYFVVGPLLEQQSDFEPQPTPKLWQDIFKELQQQGIFCVYGTWAVPGRPTALLVSAKGLVARKDELKFMYWQQYKIDSLHAGWEFEEPMCWSTAAAILVDTYARSSRERTLAQCHEWMAGFTVLHLKAAHSSVSTVFTTHATMLGRTISGNGHDLYQLLDSIDAQAWAYRYGVQDKHLCEVACAHASDIFTTVSDITALEAEKLLGRKPDVVLYNGFHIERFPSFEETSIKHYQSREALREFIAYHFFPYYAFDLDSTLLYFTSGRYEFHNKGIDTIVGALAQLNNRLKTERSASTVVMFFWVIMGHGNVRYDVLENKNAYTQLKALVDWQSKQLQRKIILDLLSDHLPGQDDMFTSTFVRELHQEIGHLKRKGLPPIQTHDILDADKDPLLTNLQARGLTNAEDDRVKIILYPGYLDSADTLLNLSYYDATVGTHLGIFPSAYEPWGYTPLESTMLGVPAITTDVAGFGKYMDDVPHEKGVIVINRRGRSEQEVTDALAQELYAYTHLDKNERVHHGFAAKQLASLCDWKHFIKYYLHAHKLALEKHAG